MTQLSRPYQVAMVVVLVVALALVVGLRLHGSSGTSPAPEHSLAAPQNGGGHHGAAVPGKAGSTSRQGGHAGQGDPATTKGSATPSKPGAKGTASTSKPGSKGAANSSKPAPAATSKQGPNGSATPSKPAPASAPKPGASKHASHPPASAPASKPSTTAGGRPVGHSGSATHRSASKGAGGHGTHHAGSPAVEIARELHRGKVALVLFWNPASSNDIAVHGQVLAAAKTLGSKVAVHVAKPSQVGSFGTVTRDISVYQTPTLLVIAPSGKTTTLTGLEDAFAITQAVREARKAGH